MKRIILFLILFFPLANQAQNIYGSVKNAYSGEALSGVLIQSDETSSNSDHKGEFSISCSESLKISLSGFESQLVNIQDCNEILSISLKPLPKELKSVEVRAAVDKPLHDINQAISSLKARELQRGKSLFLDEAINSNVPGVNMWRRTVSGGQQLNIRGYGNGLGFRGASNNFNTQGSKVYLNGIPITDAEGITIMDDIDFASIASVNIQKGPAGSLYGFAIAGAIELEMENAEAGKSYLEQKAMIGEYGVQRYTTTLTLGATNSSLLINYGKQFADGYMEHTASEKDFVNLLAKFRLNDKQTIESYLGYSNSYDERGGELTIEQFENGERTGNARYIKNDAHSAIERFRFGLSHHYKLKPWLKNQTTLYGNAGNGNSSSAGGWNDESPINYGLRTDFLVQLKWAEKYQLNGHTGLELQAMSKHALSYSMVEDSLFPNQDNIVSDLKSNQQINNLNKVWFSQWELKMPKGFAVEAGLSLSSLSINLQNRMYQNGNDLNPTYALEYNNYWSPHLAIRKSFANSWNIFASYNKSYRTPVSGNIIIGATGELNTGLSPENGSQIEIGSQGKIANGRLTYQLSAFRTLFRNKMTSVAVPLDSVTTAYTYVSNSGGQNNQGIEALFRYEAISKGNRFFESIQAWTNLTLNNFKYQDFYYEGVARGASQVSTKVYNNLPVAGVAPFSWNSGLDVLGRKGWYGNINYRHQGKMAITSDGKNETNAFGVLNLKAGYHLPIGDAITIHAYAGANNITSERYYYMVFVNQLADAYLPAPDRINFYGGLDLRFQF